MATIKTNTTDAMAAAAQKDHSPKPALFLSSSSEASDHEQRYCNVNEFFRDYPESKNKTKGVIVSQAKGEVLLGLRWR